MLSVVWQDFCDRAGDSVSASPSIDEPTCGGLEIEFIIGAGGGTLVAGASDLPKYKGPVRDSVGGW